MGMAGDINWIAKTRLMVKEQAIQHQCCCKYRTEAPSTKWCKYVHLKAGDSDADLGPTPEFLYNLLLYHIAHVIEEVQLLNAWRVNIFVALVLIAFQ